MHAAGLVLSLTTLALASAMAEPLAEMMDAQTASPRPFFRGIECHALPVRQAGPTTQHEDAVVMMTNNCSRLLQANTGPAAAAGTFTLNIKDILPSLKSIKRRTFTQIPEIKKVSSMVIDSQVETLEAGAFSDVPGLNSLDISHNFVSNISSTAFNGLHNLTILRLRFNQLEEIPDDTLEGLDSLQQLYLGDNELTRIPVPLPNSLKILDLATNRIKSVDQPSGSDTVLPSPLQVDLCQNNFTSFENPPFSVVDMRILCLGSNVRTINSSVIIRMRNLEKLVINAERAPVAPNLGKKTLEAISFLPQLQSLSINNFAIANFSAFAKMKSVTLLSLTKIPNAEFVNLDALLEMKKLRSVYVKQSPLLASTLLSSEKMAPLLGQLEELSLPLNDISRLPQDPEKVFGGLHKLDISGNHDLECDCAVAWIKRRQGLGRILLSFPRKTWCYSSAADSKVLLAENEVSCLETSSSTSITPTSASSSQRVQQHAPHQQQAPSITNRVTTNTPAGPSPSPSATNLPSMRSRNKETSSKAIDTRNATRLGETPQRASPDHKYLLIVIGSLLALLTAFAAVILVRRKIMKNRHRQQMCPSGDELQTEDSDVPVVYSKLDTRED